MFAATATNALAARSARFNSNTVSQKVRSVVSSDGAIRARVETRAKASWRSPRFSRRDGGGATATRVETRATSIRARVSVNDAR